MLKLNSFNKKLFLVGGGTVLSQLLPILASPVHTRIFSNSEFGFFLIFFSIVSLVAVFNTGKLELGIIGVNSEQEAKNLLLLCFWFIIITSAMVFILIILFKIINPALYQSIFFFSPSIFLLAFITVAFNQSLIFWFNRIGNLKSIASGRILQSLIFCLLSILLGWLTQNVYSLPIAFIISHYIFTGYLIYVFKDWKFFLTVPNIDLYFFLKKHKKYPLFNATTSTVDRFTTSAPLYFVNAFFPSGVVGNFGLMERVLAAPTSVISAAFSQVIINEGGELARNKKEILPLYLQSLKKLLLIGIPIYGAIFFIAPQAFSFFFGESWYDAGLYARYFSLIFFLRFVISPLSSLLLVTDKVRLVAKWHLIYFGITSFSLVCAFIFGNLQSFFFSIIISEVFSYFYYLYLIRKSLK